MHALRCSQSAWFSTERNILYIITRTARQHFLLYFLVAKCILFVFLGIFCALCLEQSQPLAASAATLSCLSDSLEENDSLRKKLLLRRGGVNWHLSMCSPASLA